MFLNGIIFFLKEREEVKDDKWPGHPVTVKTDKDVKKEFYMQWLLSDDQNCRRRFKYELGNVNYNHKLEREKNLGPDGAKDLEERT